PPRPPRVPTLAAGGYPEWAPVAPTRAMARPPGRSPCQGMRGRCGTSPTQRRLPGPQRHEHALESICLSLNRARDSQRADFLIQAGCWAWRPAAMARAYSEDLRERFCRALDRGMSARGAARQLEVSASTGVKWAQRWRATGTLSAKPMGGRRPLVLESERDWLLARLERQ